MRLILFATLAALRLTRTFGASLWPLIPFAAVAGAALTWRDLVFCLALYLFALVVPGPGAARRGRMPCARAQNLAPQKTHKKVVRAEG